MVETRQLGRTELHITPVGFGTWALGGGHWAFGWGHQDEGEAVAAIRRAVELGMNWLDTAAVYGLGRSEEIVAKALQDISPSERPYVFTKCSQIWDSQGRISHSLRADSIRREIEGSLRRLRTEVIDLYQIHWPAIPPGAPAPAIEEGWSTLVDLQSEGKVRYLGVSNFSVAELERIRRIAPVDSLQPPYSLLRRDSEKEILPYCREHDIGVIVYSPLQAGLLTGKMTKERVASLPANDWRSSKSPYFQEPALSRNLAFADFLRTWAAGRGVSAAEVAIAWTLRHPAVTGAIVGGRRPAQVDELIGAMELRLSPEEIAEIEGRLPASGA